MVLFCDELGDKPNSFFFFRFYTNPKMRVGSTGIKGVPTLILEVFSYRKSSRTFLISFLIAPPLLAGYFLLSKQPSKIERACLMFSSDSWPTFPLSNWWAYSKISGIRTSGSRIGLVSELSHLLWFDFNLLPWGLGFQRILMIYFWGNYDLNFAEIGVDPLGN